MNLPRLVTPVNKPKRCATLSHQTPMLLIGSCFTSNMGQRLAVDGFDVMQNPYGTLYNPISIAQVLSHILMREELSADRLYFDGTLWHSWQHHGDFSSTSREQCLLACRQAQDDAYHFLQRCHTLFITFGTAHVFSLVETGQVVANCHKAPARLFERRRLTVEDIVRAWQPLLSLLPQNIRQIVFTVSPIRHMADGAHDNQLSKSTLLLAVDQLTSQQDNGPNNTSFSSDVHNAPTEAAHNDATAPERLYFPAYEILLDELRDYRFYSDDLVHPSTVAIDIVYRRMQEYCMSQETVALAERVGNYRRLAQHRPLHPESALTDQHQAKLRQLRLELEQELGRRLNF